MEEEEEPSRLKLSPVFENISIKLKLKEVSFFFLFLSVLLEIKGKRPIPFSK